MKKTIIILSALITLQVCSYAQEEVNDTTSNITQRIKETANIQNIDVTELQKKIKELTDRVNALTVSENKLKNKQLDDTQKIEDQKATIKYLEERLVFADTIVARLSNDCLHQKYDAKKVANAISDFENMYSTELKSKLRQLKVLLTEYGNYTQEIKDIFLEAQNDKNLNNIFTGQQRALTYIDKIKSTRYYKEAYNKNWTIPYLNKVIDKSIEVINNFNPKNPEKPKELHLIELMK